MKSLPSIGWLWKNAVGTAKRFSWALLAAVVCTSSAVYLSKHSFDIENVHNAFWWDVMLCSYLYMLLQVSITVYTERKGWSALAKNMASALGGVLAVAYYFTAPTVFTEDWLRNLLFALGLHWLIAFAPFTAKGEMNGFWQYNKILFLRILTSFLYTWVLYAGLAIALLAVEMLFGYQFNKMYFYLWLVLNGIFNTWFFLAGFPNQMENLETSTNYPKGLKIFTQYVLLPIITIYLAILYAYGGKIAIHWQLPVGWVSYMVLCFSVLGILSLLLIHPIRHQAANQWMISFARFFYLALLPLVGLLFLAIIKRLKDYGFTEPRYFVLLLAIWLLVTALYFIFSKKKNIKWIPVSLFLLAFASSFGPWGAFSVSLYSQRQQLTQLFGKYHLLVNGKLTTVTNQPSFEDRKTISSIVEYLVSNHSYNSMQPYFHQNLDSLARHKNTFRNHGRVAYCSAEEVLDLINLKYVNRYETNDTASVSNSNYLKSEADSTATMIDVKGYRYAIKSYGFSSFNNQRNDYVTTYQAGNDTVQLRYNSQKGKLVITQLHTNQPPLEMDILGFIHQLDSSYARIAKYEHNLPKKTMTIIIPSKCRMVFDEVYWETSNHQNHITSFNATILIN